LRTGLIDHGVLYLAAGLAGGRGREVFGGVFDTITEIRPVRILGAQAVGPDLRIDFRLEAA
jgi:riboflavin biosynthesis pyrimidine reductase